MFPNVLSPVRNNRCVFKVQYKETFLRDSWVHVHPHFRALSGLDNWEEKDLGNQRLSSSYISELTQQDGRGKKTAKLVSPSFCKETRGGVELSRLFSQANFITNWDFSNGISLGCGSSSKYLSLSSLTTQVGWYRIDGNNVVFFFKIDRIIWRTKSWHSKDTLESPLLSLKKSSFQFNSRPPLAYK